ncbi:MAG TPA: hypothetical protein VLM89_07905 [Phycisphaerae bacterium]|nr:hypothetical protein [Phycisphaerae bacterium]
MISCCTAVGCATSPANEMRFSVAGRPMERWPISAFTRGACVDRGGEAVVLLTLPRATLLFDTAGTRNRFQLMLQDGPQYTVYDRVGTLDAPVAALEGYKPEGLGLRRVKGCLHGRVDVFVERGDSDPYDPRFERLPRAFRVSGTVDVPIVSDDTLEGGALTELLLAHKPTAGLYPLRPGSALEHAAQLLPRLEAPRR